jgi:hypothetical protein
MEVGRCYPLLFLASGLAGLIGPLFGGLLLDWRGGYLVPVTVGACSAVAGAWWTGRMAGTCAKAP